MTIVANYILIIIRVIFCEICEKYFYIAANFLPLKRQWNRFEYFYFFYYFSFNYYPKPILRRFEATENFAKELDKSIQLIQVYEMFI